MSVRRLLSPRFHTVCYACRVLGIHKRAWLLILLSAGLQVVIFPLPNLYFLSWIAIAPLLVGLLRARDPGTLQFEEGIRLLPAKPWQGFVLAYVCGILWYGFTCYWIYPTMRHFGGVNAPAGCGILILFCMYLALYHGAFGLLLSWLAGRSPFSRRALVGAPALWVGVELARTRITGFPWDLLGITQVDNIPLARIARFTGVYGLSFEIMVVNSALAAAFLLRREKRKPLLMMGLAAAVVLQAGRLVTAPASPADHTAVLVQENIPILDSADWTTDYFSTTMHDLTSISADTAGRATPRPDLIVWPESPSPFYTSDSTFRDAVSGLARQTGAWMVVGAMGTGNASQSGGTTQAYNSAALVSPSGEWVSRYDKVHLVPFGEYVPFRRVFSFASGLTAQVGDFTRGASRRPLQAENKLGVFICYESIFPDEIRQSVAEGAQVFVNISNDGWYGDSGAYAQHLKQARMRAVENDRWLLRDTNTGVTASIDPYGRVVAQVPRKTRTALIAPYALSGELTFYTRYGDWFAGLCGIGVLVAGGLRLFGDKDE